MSKQTSLVHRGLNFPAVLLSLPFATLIKEENTISRSTAGWQLRFYTIGKHPRTWNSRGNTASMIKLQWVFLNCSCSRFASAADQRQWLGLRVSVSRLSVRRLNHLCCILWVPHAGAQALNPTLNIRHVGSCVVTSSVYCGSHRREWAGIAQSV